MKLYTWTLLKTNFANNKVVVMADNVGDARRLARAACLRDYGIACTKQLTKRPAVSARPTAVVGY